MYVPSYFGYPWIRFLRRPASLHKIYAKFASPHHRTGEHAHPNVYGTVKLIFIIKLWLLNYSNHMRRYIHCHMMKDLHYINNLSIFTANILAAQTLTRAVIVRQGIKFIRVDVICRFAKSSIQPAG